MSKEIYGFVDLPADTPRDPFWDDLRSSTPLGLFEVSARELYGFPSDLCPGPESAILLVGDGPDSRNASYLLDDQDYDPKAEIGLPIQARERLALLLELLNRLFVRWNASRVVVCLTVCNEVDDVKRISRGEMFDILPADCAVESPPCLIYVISA